MNNIGILEERPRMNAQIEWYLPMSFAKRPITNTEIWVKVKTRARDQAVFRAISEMSSGDVRTDSFYFLEA